MCINKTFLDPLLCTIAAERYSDINISPTIDMHTVNVKRFGQTINSVQFN